MPTDPLPNAVGYGDRENPLSPGPQIMSAKPAKDPFSIDSLAAELIREHGKLEKAKKHFERLKYDLLKKLTADNVGAVKVKEGTVTVCTRSTKDYGQSVKVLVAAVEAEKARLDYLKEFIITKETQYIRVN
jgi:hypothetical protein